MRVLHVNKFLHRRGGAEGYLLDVARLQRAAGDTVEYFGMDHPENEPGLSYVRHFPARMELEPAPAGLRKASAAGRMVWSPSARRGLDRVLADFRPDVVHLHNIYHQLSPSILAAARDAGVPCVLTLHDYKLACPSYRMLDHGKPCDACVTGGVWQAARRSCKDGSRSASALLSLESWLHRRMGAYEPVGVFLAPSEFLAAVMRRAGVFPDRLRVLPLFLDPAAITTRRAPAGRSVVYAGRLSAEKGVDVLIRAVAELPPEVPVEIAGDGPDRAALTALAERVVPGRVRFHGRLGTAALHDLIRTAATVAVPSRWYENQPLSVLEAFGCGVPVVATDLGGLPELVEDGVDGYTVPADDPSALAAALCKLTADPVLSWQLGRAGRAKAEVRFGPGAHLTGLRSAYAAAGALV
jgi:glycosyltransferase involved in cell wall biosynthesis